MSTIRNLTNTIPTYLIYVLAFLLPLIFTPLTTEFYETSKLILLSVTVLLLIFFWGVRVFTENKISLVKTPLDLLLLLFLTIALLSTIFSPTPFVALYGLLPKVHGSLIFITSIILLYFMVASNIRSARDIRIILQIMIFSGLILSIVSILSFFKIYLPWNLANFQNFSLAGSSSSALTYIAIIFPLALTQTLLDKNLKNLSLSTIFGAISTFIFALTIVLIGNTEIWIAAILALAAVLFFQKPSKAQFGFLAVPGIIILLISILIYTPTIKDKTPLGNFSSSLQKDSTLPFNFSWKISAGAFRDSPILGTGPGTYLYNFTEYKPLEINSTDLWDKRVSSANNFYLQTLAELGGTGLIIILSVAVTFIFIALKNRDQEGLAIAGILFFILLALSPMSVLGQTGGFLIIALFMTSLQGRHHQVRQMEVSLRSETGTHPLLPIMIFIPTLALVFAGFYFVGRLSLGEYYHRLALNFASNSKSLDSYNMLVQAEKVNPQIDLYRLDLAQTNFAIANGIAASRGPTEASPSGTLTEKDRQNIGQLLQQSVAEGRAATQLAPASARNWEVLAQIYRQISGVAENGTHFALDAYGRAIKQDPLNPVLRLAVGGIYYQAKNYDLAVRFYDDAVALKPDYSNGLYNLAIALRDKGNRADAIRVAERLVASLQGNSESDDYKTASEFLSKLKEQESYEQPQSDIPPAALENEQLPDVLDDQDLGTREQVSTPPAIQR